MHNLGCGPNIIEHVLDAYIIEEIRKRDEARRRDEEEARPRLHIDIPGWPERNTDVEVPYDPREPQIVPDEDDGGGAIHIDL